MTGWISCKLESRLPREISNLRYMDDTTLMAESKEKLDQIRSDQSLSHVRLFVTPWIAARQASLSITNLWSSLRLMSWCHPAISSSVVPFSSCPQSLPASESFPMSQLFAWGGQSTGVSASASFLPKKSQGWCPFYWHIIVDSSLLWSFVFLCFLLWSLHFHF